MSSALRKDVKVYTITLYTTSTHSLYSLFIFLEENAEFNTYMNIVHGNKSYAKEKYYLMKNNVDLLKGLFTFSCLHQQEARALKKEKWRRNSQVTPNQYTKKGKQSLIMTW